MRQKRILIISDNMEITDMLKIHMEAEGCLVDSAIESDRGLELYQHNFHDLVVIDMALKDTDSIKLAVKLRDVKDTSVVFLTEEHKQHGISLDVVTKAANEIDIENIDELLFLVAEQFELHKRRVIEKQDRGFYECGNLKVDLTNKQVWVNNKDIQLSEILVNLLVYLILNEDNYISKKQLYQEVWNNPVGQNDSTVMAHIRNLRRELGDDDISQPLYIHTKRGVGYMFSCSEKTNKNL